MSPVAADTTPKPRSPRRSAWRWCLQLAGTFKFRVLLVAVMSALLSGVASSYFMAYESERVILRSFSLQQRDEVELAADT